MTPHARAWTIGTAVVLLAACRAAPPDHPAGSPSATLANEAATPASRPASPGAPPTAALPVPFESEGACPFECCVYRTWSVQRATDVRGARQKDAPVAFTLPAGGKVEALTGVVVVSRLGRARASREVAIEGLGTLRAGDEATVLHPVGEGYWLVWRDGKKGTAQVGPKSDRPGPWDPELNPIETPEFRWWVQVRDGQGRTGWTDAPDHFGNKDRCG
jgi:hypothetical protein